MNASSINDGYRLAKERYGELGVNTGAALDCLRMIPISVQCWQGDDVAGFESTGGLSGGGIMATGNYPGRARNADELRADAAKAFSLRQDGSSAGGQLLLGGIGRSDLVLAAT